MGNRAGSPATASRCSRTARSSSRACSSHRQRAARGDHRDLHPVRGQGRPASCTTALLAAARRGVQVDLMIDGFGSPDLSPEFIAALTAAGVRVRVFDPGQRFLGQRLNLFRRMHRKIVVVDGARRLRRRHQLLGRPPGATSAPRPSRTTRSSSTGPIVTEIHRFVLHAIAVGGKGHGAGSGAACARRQPQRQRAGRRRRGACSSRATTGATPNDIERHYRAAIRSARASAS